MGDLSLIQLKESEVHVLDLVKLSFLLSQCIWPAIKTTENFRGH